MAMGSNNKVLASTSRQLRHMRQSLVRLHKALLDHEQEAYERAHGRINSSYEVLKLVMHDPWFAWLHTLSGLVVQIDEMLDAEEPPTDKNVTEVVDRARAMLAPSETGDQFQRKYFASLQKSPDAILAHSQAVKLLGTRPSG